MSLKRLQKVQFNINDKIGQIEKLVGKEGDNLTRGLEIQLLHNSVVVDDISDIDCMLIAKQEGAGVEDTFVVPSVKANNKFEIIYPSNLMKKGIVEGEIRFTQGEQILTSFIFEIDMARTLVVEEITDSIYEQRLIDVIVEVVANEDARIANEEERQINESTREANESERKSSEIERDNQESIRQSNEDARVVEENTRKSNESTRETNEGIRESNENTRQTNEDTRESNEVDRVDFFEMLQQMLENGELNGEVTLAELTELAGAGRTDETVKGNADKIDDLQDDISSHLAESAKKHIHSSGSNDDGYWIRYDDGTQVCYGNVTRTGMINESWGPVFFRDFEGITYPLSFVGVPELIVGNKRLYILSVVTVGVHNPSKSGEVRITRATSSSSDSDYMIGYIAIGRWK